MSARRVDSLPLDTSDDLAFCLVSDVLDRSLGGQAGMLDSWTRYRVNSQDGEKTTGLVAELAAHGLVLLDDVTGAARVLCGLFGRC